MKLTDVTKDSVKTLSNVEILSLHRRLHQLYALGITRKNNEEYIKLLVKTHRIIVNAMKARKFVHRTPISVIESFLQTIQK